MHRTLTATIWREDDGYVSLCSEVDVASQGETVEEARNNLREAVELFFETANPSEISDRLNSEVYITPMEVEVGALA
ncbi:MAG: type II toxin-antitoxin system HicB family antitoxin [Pyrinomonadaceae bacterium]